MKIEVTRAGLENKVVTPTRSLGSKKQDLTWSDPSHPLPLGLAALEPGKCLEGLPWVNRTGVHSKAGKTRRDTPVGTLLDRDQDGAGTPMPTKAFPWQFMASI